MGFVKQPKVPDHHRCYQPANDWFIDKGFTNAVQALGTVWECDECGQRYKWDVNLYRPAWVRIRANAATKLARKMKRHG